MMEKLQKLGKALMGAVAVMPVAAILMGIGYWLDPVGWGSENVAAAILIKSGGAVLDNLGYIFAVAIAFGLAKDSNGAAAISGFIGFQTILLLLGEKSVAGYRGIDLDKLEGDAKLDWVSQGYAAINSKNVLIGILVGLLAAWVYNRFHATKLPDFLAFFSGRRLVPILTALLAIVLAGVLYFVWPLIYGALFHFGQAIQGMGAAGAGIYALFNRLLIPTGLHHALNSIFWFDVIGINDIGKFLKGAETIAAAAGAGDAATCPGVFTNGHCEVIGIVGRYQAGFFPIMMFGLVGAALAIYLRADSRNKKVVGSLMAAGALASFFTGVTEPLEFSFMFVAPLLYGIHAVLTGISVFIAAAMHWTAGFGFSAGFVDMFLSASNPIANQWYMLILLGVVFFGVYFGIFYLLIGKLNLKTPGRGEELTQTSTSFSNADSKDQALALQLIDGLGGKDNITSVDYCATRLRVKVKDDAQVNESAIKSAQVAGMIRPGSNAVQIIIGPNVQFVYDAVAAEMSHTAAALQGEQEI